MSTKHLSVEKKDNLGLITLNRPEVMNAMSKQMIFGLHEAIREIGSDEGVRVLILKGAGDHFCSGADLSLFAAKTRSYEWITAMKAVGHIIKSLRSIPQPIISAIKGVAVGGGVNLALAADFVVAAEDARLCEIFINIGAIMDYGGNYFLPRLVGLAKARELAMLGDEIDGKTAAAIGLIYRSVPKDDLDREVEALADKLARKPPLAIRLIKEGLEKSFDRSLEEVLDWEAAHQSIALQTPEHKEIVKMFLEAKKKKES
ncbi:MAG: enoyl-CoA hydratase-related protein [Desulfobacterales bacterium]|nr:enoyl-CoA hydratase-related protein [Desulfobacterales bacterium]